MSRARWVKHEHVYPTGLREQRLHLRAGGEVVGQISTPGLMASYRCMISGCGENCGTTDIAFLRRLGSKHYRTVHAEPTP